MTAATAPIPDPGWIFEMSPITGLWFGAWAKGLLGDNSVGQPRYSTRIVTPWCATLEEATEKLDLLMVGAEQ